MSYASYAQAIARYSLLATWSQTNVENDLLHYAAIELNGMMASHFAVPFGGNHPTVVDLNIDLAYYRAIRAKDPKKAAEMRQDIIGRIDAIKDGKEYIYTDSGTTIAPSGGGAGIWSSVQDYHPVHSMLDAEDQEIDQDRLDDETDELD
jgi:hypothetical protein